MNIKELKTLLNKNDIPFYAYWGKKRLLNLANEHDLLPKPEPKKEKSKNDKNMSWFNRLTSDALSGARRIASNIRESV